MEAASEDYIFMQSFPILKLPLHALGICNWNNFSSFQELAAPA